MKLSERIGRISESLTLKSNAQAAAFEESGRKVYNLTAGQLQMRPHTQFIDLIGSQLDIPRSYHYTPVKGLKDLCAKVLDHHQKTRGVQLGAEFDAMITAGGKQALINIISAMIDPGDEVVVLAPYWTSYPEMVRYCQGEVKLVTSGSYQMFVPQVSDIEKVISDKTKLIIINSPNNPCGISYSKEWMEEFAQVMKKHPQVYVISDEIYYQLSYFDPKPVYFYQLYPELIARTLVIDGISKTLASTGLRIGWAIAPRELISAMVKLQGQTTSGANSLVQWALVGLDFSLIDDFLEDVAKGLRLNATALRDAYAAKNISDLSYGSTSAFYYLIDFTNLPVMEKHCAKKGKDFDYSFAICKDLLDTCGVAAVPGGAFGMPNCARISLAMEATSFAEAVELLLDFVTYK